MLSAAGEYSSMGRLIDSRSWRAGTAAMRKATLIIAAVLLDPGVGAAQPHPNFAGTWVLQNTVGNESMAQRLIVEQPVTRWLPRSPAYLTLYVEWHFPDRVGVEHHELDAQGMAEVELGAGEFKMHMIRRWLNRWQGQVLRIEMRTFPSSSANYSVIERVETWRLNSTGTLIIDRRLNDGGRQDIRTLYYQKQTGERPPLIP